MLPLFFFLLFVFFSLHKIAADLAIEATGIFLSDIRSTVGDDIFAKFLNLKSENSMALVIDVSGSMSGELKTMIPFFFFFTYISLYKAPLLLSFLVGYLGGPVGLGLDCKTVWLLGLTMTAVIRQKCAKVMHGTLLWVPIYASFPYARAKKSKTQQQQTIDLAHGNSRSKQRMKLCAALKTFQRLESY